MPHGDQQHPRRPPPAPAREQAGSAPRPAVPPPPVKLRPPVIATAADGIVSLNLVKAAGGMTADAITWSVLWKTDDDPVVVTDFVAGYTELGHRATVRVIKSKPQGVWNTRQRLLPQMGVAAKFPRYPTATQLEPHTPAVPIASLESLWSDIVDEMSQNTKDPKVGKGEVGKQLDRAVEFEFPEGPQAKHIPPDATLIRATVIDFPSGGRSVLVSFRPEAGRAGAWSHFPAAATVAGH